MKDEIDIIIEKFPKNRRENLIQILQEIQEGTGYLSEESIVKTGKFLRLPTSKIYGIATFYNQFSFVKKGKYHFQVCHGTACHVFGASTLIQELEKQLKISHGETSRDGLFSLEISTCIGACGKAPVIAVNDTFYTHFTPEGLKELIEKIGNEQEII
jgi:NADH-quinone oxidoreductase E subunit